MAYTEKVLLSGTALSFLLYECVNSVNSQEGFLIGDVTSEITNHISDSQSDNARLDTQIIIRTVLPLPSVSLFYLPTGRIKDEVLKEVLADSASEIVGWYKYRKNSSIKPTFRDKLIAKGLQKYFEKHHGKKNFVTCNLSSKTSSAGSTHTFSYRFGKINCLDMYEYIEDVTANLGEKLIGYRKPHRLPPHSIFSKIVRESNVQSENTDDAILRIQEAVNMRLAKEAKIAAENEIEVQALDAEVKQMKAILADKQAADLQAACEKINAEKLLKSKAEIAEACALAIKSAPDVDILNCPNIIINSNNRSQNDNSVQIVVDDVKERSPSPILVTSRGAPQQTSLNYAAALKNRAEKPCTSKTNNFSDDLITFDIDENHVEKLKNDDVKCIGDSSPEY